MAAPADLVSVSAHKFGGPKGVGALVVREGIEVEPQLVGGGQERGLRSGTVDVAGAVGLATALRVTTAQRAAEVARIGVLRDRLADRARRGAGCGRPTATGRGSSPATTTCGSRASRPRLLLVALDREDVCAAAGSSCASGALEPSPVLAAMGMSREAAREAVRFSLGYAVRPMPTSTGRSRSCRRP